jgi:predicted acylesterase/phospholipase RssA
MIKECMRPYLCGLMLLLPWPVFSAQASQQDERYVPVALAISGGISLGAYEAGLNWAIIKQLKYIRENPHERTDNYPPNLVGIAGASAGGINALVSAMSWCMDEQRMQTVAHDALDNNLFRDIWLDVGFNNLLPENPAEYDRDDGLLSRRAFDKVINRISVLLDKNIYRDGCHIPVALTVTRTEPVILNVGGIEVRNQRFVIPFMLQSSITEPGKLELVSYLMNRDDPMLGNVIYLQSGSGDGVHLHKDNVINAVLASSAFPVAFGRVALDYCLYASEDIVSANVSQGKCPSGYVATRGEFVDGGVFDNVPLGVAKALTEAHVIPDDVKYNYIYLDPASRRTASGQIKKVVNQFDWLPNGGYGLSSQLSFLGGAIASGEEYELYNVLRSSDWSGKDKRRILLTTRNPPITGEFLAHFGAFIDEPFREYDYYAGVYDGIINIARYRCLRIANNENDLTCLANESMKIYTELTKEYVAENNLNQARAILAALARHEYQNTVGETNWRWMWEQDIKPVKSNAMKVATTLMSVASERPDTDPDLKSFMLKLPADYDVTHSSFVMRRIMKLRHEDELKWFYPLASRASLRLLDLERQEQQVTGDSMRGLVGLAALGVETTLGDRDDFVWNQSTALDNKYQWLPYEVAYDVFNTGWSVSWEPSWMFSRPWSLNVKITPFGYQKLNGERTEYSQFDVLLSHKNESSFFSSWGVGPGYNHLDMESTAADSNNAGLAVYAGFFGDKLRLTLGRRAPSDKFSGDELYMYLGLTDLPGISYWVRRIYW